MVSEFHVGRYYLGEINNCIIYIRDKSAKSFTIEEWGPRTQDGVESAEVLFSNMSGQHQKEISLLEALQLGYPIDPREIIKLRIFFGTISNIC